MIKAAAKRLLDKGKITKEEYSELEKLAGPIPPNVNVSKLLHALKNQRSTISSMTRTIDSLKRAAAHSIKRPAVEPTMIEQILRAVKPVAMGTAAVGAAGLLGKEIFDQASQAIDINKTFTEMQQKVPQLQQYEPEEMKDYFDVVKIYSPKAASNPLVAGALVNKMMAMGGVDHKLVQDISQIENKPHSGMLFDLASIAAKSMVAMPKPDGGAGAES